MEHKFPPAYEESEAQALRSVDEVAARWCELMVDAPDRKTREAFVAWRTQSPEHAAAYERVRAARALAASLAHTPEMQSLRRETLERLSQAKRHCAHRVWGWSIAASVLVATVVGALNLHLHRQQTLAPDVAERIYQTGVGERSVVTLDDGSVITLNTDSRVATHFAPGLRGVTLERGQALFKVAKDASRPFVVSAGGRQVTALGTEFDVYLSERSFEVTLLEGRVTVSNADANAAGRAGAAAKPVADAAAKLAELRPGQQFVVVAKAKPQVRPADVKRVVSWRHGQIVFENDRLEDAIAEINRYSQRKIVLGDSGLASLRISGAFNTYDTRTFVEALTAYFPIEHGTLANDDIVLKPRPSIRG